jgi:hypothetical protein
MKSLVLSVCALLAVVLLGLVGTVSNGVLRPINPGNACVTNQIIEPTSQQLEIRKKSSSLINSALRLYSDRDFVGADQAIHSCFEIDQSLTVSLYSALIDCESNDKESAIMHVKALIEPDARRRRMYDSKMPAYLMTLAQNMDRFGRPDLADKCIDRVLKIDTELGALPDEFYSLAEKYPCKTREVRFNRAYALASGYSTLATFENADGTIKYWTEYTYWPEVNLDTNDPIVLYRRGGWRGHVEATQFEIEANFRKILDIVRDEPGFREKCWNGLLAAIYDQRPYDREKYRHWKKIMCEETGQPFREDQPGVLTPPTPAEKAALKAQMDRMRAIVRPGSAL